ncbi:MAG: HAD family acid phosphatase [Candidatus Obscuribacterales bacterium]|nr:HAD family acid phosphatase [Candidatus Obscuribacterales bacterium]
MKKSHTAGSALVKSLASFLIVGSIFGQTASACPCHEVKVPSGPANDFTPKEGMEFRKTAQYKKEFSQAIADAKKACMKHLGEKDLAIVSDIDETVLDNQEYFKTHEKFAWEEFNNWVEEAKAPTLKQTADFLAWARKNGFAIFFITGRGEIDRRGTINNLVKRNIAYDGLYMRPTGDDSVAEDMKSRFRKKIQDMGYNIIVNIGDQYSDLAGGLSEDCEKLPNKMYFIK